MDKIDYNLICLKSENARIKLRDISQKLKKSSQRLNYTLSVYGKDGYLRDPYAVIDYSYFGIILFRVYFKGGYSSEHDKMQIVNELVKNPYVLSVYELTGEFDLVVEFGSPNPSRFNKELKKIATLNPILNDYKIVLNVVTHMYPRNYLLQDGSLASLFIEKIIGGDREKETFTENEMAFLKQIALHPVKGLTKLAKAAGLNVKTVTTIFKTLKKRRIIKSFRYIVDTNKLGINKNRLFLKLHNVSLERENQLMQFMQQIKEIVQVNKTVGDWDMEVDLEAKDAATIRSVILQLREQFRDLIERFNVMEFYLYYHQSYIPMYLFKQEKV